MFTIDALTVNRYTCIQLLRISTHKLAKLRKKRLETFTMMWIK